MPACPRCGDLCPPGAKTCECGARLTLECVDCGDVFMPGHTHPHTSRCGRCLRGYRRRVRAPSRGL